LKPLFIAELTRIGIETVKKELANGIVPKVPKAEKYQILSKVQPIDNCFSGFQVFWGRWEDGKLLNKK
jgi:hypothetical protein